MRRALEVQELGTTQVALDASGTILSLLCAAHCMLLPALLSLFPALGLEVLKQPWVHIGLLVLVLPVVVLALGRGIKSHGQVWIGWLGGAGLSLLVGAVIFGHGLHLEGAMTLAGSLLLTAAHAANILACRTCCPPAVLDSQMAK